MALSSKKFEVEPIALEGNAGSAPSACGKTLLEHSSIPVLDEMSQTLGLPGEEAWKDILNALSELLYIVDVQTREILFMNTAAKRTLGISDYRGRYCYEALHCRLEPCENCVIPRLDHNSFYTYEQENTHLNRRFLLSNRLLWWKGREAQLEIAYDITEKSALENTLQAANVVMDCVKLLYQAKDTDRALEEILKILGETLEARYAFLFEITESENMVNIREWMPREETANRWGFREFLNSHLHEPLDCSGPLMVVDDETPKVDSSLKRLLRERGIRSLIEVPIRTENKLVGCLGVCNHRAGKIQSGSFEQEYLVVEALAYFVALAIVRQEGERFYERMSYFDMLTDVRNHNAYMRDVDAIAQSGQPPLGVAFVDVNGLKDINDRYGHQEGDRILVDTGRRLLEIFSPQEVYRVGGDEFVVLCQAVPRRVFAERINNLRNLFTDREGVCRLSIGSQWSCSCADIQKLILEADEQMYEDKKKYYHNRVSRGRYHHYNDDILGMTAPNALRRMLEAGQFPVYIQPQMDIRTRTLTGAEALVRYLTVNGAVIAPDRFIPLLERARLISELDFYVFDQVCRLVADWLERESGVCPVSVNFSRHTITSSDCCRRIHDIWLAAGIPQHLVIIEVTESVEEESREEFSGVIGEIRRLGFLVSIDDFGNRNANISLFSAVDFDELKIDRSLLQHFPGNSKGRMVVQVVVDICRSMGIRLVVEGVESERQLEALRSMGVDGAVQGFLFSHPLPMEEFEQRYILCRPPAAAAIIPDKQPEMGRKLE